MVFITGRPNGDRERQWEGEQRTTFSDNIRSCSVMYGMCCGYRKYLEIS